MITKDEREMIEQYVEGRAKAAREEHGEQFIDLVCVVAGLLQGAYSVTRTVGIEGTAEVLSRSLVALSNVSGIELEEIRRALHFVRDMGNGVALLTDPTEA